MKEIKTCMIHPEIHDVDGIKNALRTIPDGVRFVWDEKEPEYLIASETIYYRLSSWNQFISLYDKAKIRIFFAGECISPDFNVFDYAVAFDWGLMNDDRVCRMPPRLLYGPYFREKKNVISDNEARALLDKKKGFCNFIYSNPNGHIMRENLYYAISEYKQVDSLGNFLNNTRWDNNKRDINLGDWVSIIQNSVEAKSNYKFSIACENASFPGYTSEKVFSSLEAHTVPVYWGDPLIAEEINPNCFINCHKYNSLNEVVDRIKEIDSDDLKWIDMVTQPWLTEEQEYREEKDIDKYKTFIDDIFSRPVEKAQRIGQGLHPDWYRKWFFTY